MFEHLFLLSSTGEPLIVRSYIGRIRLQYAERLFQIAQQDPKSEPPVLHQDGMNFVMFQRSSLYLIVASHKDMSTGLVFEFLGHVMRILHDFLGEVSESGIRRNLPLASELLDELVLHGYPQSTQSYMIERTITSAFEERSLSASKRLTRILKSVTLTEQGIVISPSDLQPIGRRISGVAPNNRVFVDQMELLKASLNAQRQVTSAIVTGEVFLLAQLEQPAELTLSLPPGLIVLTELSEERAWSVLSTHGGDAGRVPGGSLDPVCADPMRFGMSPGGMAGGGGFAQQPVWEHVAFNMDTNRDDWKMQRKVTARVFTGSQRILRYRVSDPALLVLPIDVTSTLDTSQLEHGHFELTLHVQAAFPAAHTTHGAAKFRARLTMPPGCTSVRFLPEDHAKSQARFTASSRQVVWELQELRGGGAVSTLRLRCALGGSYLEAKHLQYTPESLKCALGQLRVTFSLSQFVFTQSPVLHVSTSDLKSMPTLRIKSRCMALELAL